MINFAGYVSGSIPLFPPNGGAGAFAGASANASATANAFNMNNFMANPQSATNFGMPTAGAYAFANANASANPMIMPIPTQIPVQMPVQIPVPIPTPIYGGFPPVMGGGASAQAQAQAQAQSNDSGLLPMLMILLLFSRGILGNRGNATAQAQAQAQTQNPPPPPAQPAQPAQQQQQQVGFTANPGLVNRIVTEKTSPLVMDVNGDGVKTSTQKVQFDIDGNGQKDTVNDISQGDGVLTIDTDRNGASGENGKELLGDKTDLNGDGVADGFRDGFEALRALADDAKRRGLINTDDYLDATELQVLEQNYGLKIKQGSLNSQSTSLAQAGINGINLSNGQKDRVQNFDGQGNDTLRQQGALFTRADGSQGSYEDIFFQRNVA